MLQKLVKKRLGELSRHLCESPSEVGSDLGGCRISLGSEKMEEVSEFKYLETVLCKHGGMEGEIRE